MTSKAIIIGSAASLLIASGDKDFLPVDDERRLAPVDRDPDLPDRLSIERDSPFYSSAIQFVGVRIAGVESRDVVEYCISGRWVRLAVRNEADEIKRDPERRPHGLQTTRLDGVEIEPYWRQQPSRQIRRALRRAR